MPRSLLIGLLAALSLIQSNCSSGITTNSSLEPEALVAQQIIRSQFCTLAKVRGWDKRVFPGEEDTTSWNYTLTNRFTGRENQDSTVRYIVTYLITNHLPINAITSDAIFRAGYLALSRSVKLTICNDYHKATIYNTTSSSPRYSGLLAISQPIIINDSLRLYYYEFGKYPSANAGFSVLKFTQHTTAEPVYESSLWTVCGPE